ncbi:hypothetical protein QMK19_08355 [Streptomyces sp. H10-C2]|uniref:hypothetical protein n=1 Tax=unclassified Streptomyces TaxID=2593676 RepID=UPI0024BBE8E7|nr:MULTISPECIES: hypothetical protein [unclassified Streptomyces]MDJ0344806.1 hypothetical protein [Streptomyces sp. PH10-H1]MDJ0369691.1 hypothetical protein [Streptomyces sp. H10-C2]
MSADDYRRKFADFLAKQSMTSDITYEQVARAKTRDELGISSLNMVLVLVNYIKEYTNNTVTMRPEWVSRLGDIDGILSVLREIDASVVVPTRT